MRTSTFFRLGIAGIAIVLASCAQQPVRQTSAQPEQAPVVAPATQPPKTTPTKPKPKPKPAAPKPDASDSDVREPEAPREEGIDKSQVGYYFDTLQGQLRQSGDAKIVVSRRDAHITVDVTERVPPGRDEAAACGALEPIARALVEYRMTRVVIDVSAEEPGGANAAKSAAAALARCLAAAGVANGRIATKHASAARTSVYLRIEPIVKTP